MTGEAVNKGESGPGAIKGTAKKEAFFNEVENRIQPFSIAACGGLDDDVRTNYRLFDGDILRGTVQVLPKGFANNLHYHPAYEGAWMVVGGRVNFYGVGETLLGEFGPMEGVFIPRNGRYWFAQVGDEPARLLQLRGDSREGANKRVDVDPLHAAYGKSRTHEVKR
jgi:mannose-6-phosphate isomerase-like protein (cupin superfamily)